MLVCHVRRFMFSFTSSLLDINSPSAQCKVRSMHPLSPNYIAQSEIDGTRCLLFTRLCLTFDGECCVV
eukprot:m.693 g.693  ORF g.693 m.693 type:complete len:68 (+) comp427_c0_seq1:114-317(+)